MRQFLSFNATDVAVVSKNIGKKAEIRDLFQIKKLKLKLAQGLLNKLQSIIDLTGLEK